VPADVFLSELEFYEIDERAVHAYKKKEGYILEKPLTLPSREWQRVLWTLCEEPGSSHAARVFAIISVTCIVVTVVNFCLETIPDLEPKSCIELHIPDPNVTNNNGRLLLLKVS
jgi:potassium voltage-gated channel Shaker-related subfamily A protein 1